MEVEIVSKGMIKPSSPKHHPVYTFSYLDQIAFPTHSPTIYYYPAPAKNQIEKIANNLKKSLSETLALYYPLAGRIRQNTCIECNDDGVPFFEATAKSKLSQVIQQPELFGEHKLLPYADNDVVDNVVMAVQLNVFECGGIAIGTKISHKIMDGGSATVFMKNWAAMSRGESHNILHPCFESAPFFPPREIIEFDPPAQTILTAADERVVRKRLVFSPSKIDCLKSKYANNHENLFPTRLEAVSTFLWLRFLNAARRNRNQKVYVVSQMVDLRKRMSPPLGDNYVGNFVGFVSAKVASLDSSEEELFCTIVKQWRDSLRDIDGDYMKSLQQGNDHQHFLNDIRERAWKGEWELFMFSSLCRYPIYEVDFGWGKPILLCSVATKNMFLLRDACTSLGEGIEIWVNLKAEDMALFEGDDELLAFAEI